MLDNTMKNKPNSKRREVLKKMTFTSLGLPIISQFKMYDSKKKYDFNINRLEIHKKINTLLSDEFKIEKNNKNAIR